AGTGPVTLFDTVRQDMIKQVEVGFHCSSLLQRTASRAGRSSDRFQTAQLGDERGQYGPYGTPAMANCILSRWLKLSVSQSVPLGHEQRIVAKPIVACRTDSQTPSHLPD